MHSISEYIKPHGKLIVQESAPAQIWAILIQKKFLLSMLLKQELFPLL